MEQCENQTDDDRERNRLSEDVDSICITTGRSIHYEVVAAECGYGPQRDRQCSGAGEGAVAFRSEEPSDQHDRNGLHDQAARQYDGRLHCCPSDRPRHDLAAVDAFTASTRQG